MNKLATMFCMSAMSAFVLLTAVNFALPAPAETPPIKSTVKIVVSIGHGSGVGIAPGLIATAGHVVDGASEVKVLTEDGKEQVGQVVLFDKVDDVAFVRVPDAAAVGVSALACRTPVVGEMVELHGSPLSVDFITTWGRVAGLARQIGPWRLGIIVDATIAPGDSGGPVLDSRGDVLGIIVGLPTANGSAFAFTIAVPSLTVCGLRDALGIV